jgi:nucleoside permease NupC
VVGVLSSAGEAWIAMFGLLLIVLVSVAMSRDWRAIPWGSVGMGFALQFWLAVLLLRTGVGVEALNWLSCKALQLLNHVHRGSFFVFGEALVTDTFAFGVLPVIIFVSTLCAMLLHAGFLQAP